MSPSTDTPVGATNGEQSSTDVQDNSSTSEKNGEQSATSMAPSHTAPATALESTSTNGASKKRGREEDDVPEEQQTAKKVDTKGGDL